MSCRKIENCPGKLKRTELVEIAKLCQVDGHTNTYRSPYRNMKWLCGEIDRKVDEVLLPSPSKQTQKIKILPKGKLKQVKILPKGKLKQVEENKDEKVQQPKQAQKLEIVVNVDVCPNGNKGKVVFTGPPMLAQTIKSIDKFDPVGWYASEKYDGFRAIWNGKEFLSRQGNPFSVPEWFSALMPPGVSLDGEFWMGRCKFESCGLFRKNIPDEKEWILNRPKYLVYDIHMESNIPFQERMKLLEKLVEDRCKCAISVQLPEEIVKIGCPLEYAPQHLVKNKEGFMKYYEDLLKSGAEGVMLRKSGSLYEQNRSYTLMKLKPEFDAECTIIGYKPGTGKYSEMLGSFQCEWEKPDKKKVKFYVSGMNDEVRRNYKSTHPIGTKITFSFKGFTKYGVPKNPNYLRLFARP